jgi:hypothetical protein
VIREIEIRDLVVIERAHIEPVDGLTAITGETGAGKTVVAQALGLLAGGTADPQAVRPRAKHALVQATLQVPEGFWDSLDADDPALQVRELADDDAEVVVARRVPAEGRARALVDGQVASRDGVAAFVGALVRFSGQHEQRRLVGPAAQMAILDAFAGPGTVALAQRVAHMRRRLAALDREVAQAQEGRERAERERTDLERLVAEVDEVAPDVAEEQALLVERGRLAHAERLGEAVATAIAHLDGDGDAGALMATGRALRAIDQAIDLDPTLRAPLDDLIAGEAAIQEALIGVRRYAEDLEAQPGRLEWVESRLQRLDDLSRRYGPGLDAVVAPGGADDKDLEQLAALAVNFRVGERAGGAVPHGAKVNLVRGGNSTVIESIRYLDESTARSFLAMFLMLGQTQTGSRALGEEFADFFGMAGDAVADWICDVTTDHVIEDDVDFNDGDAVQFIPRVVSQRDEDPELDAATLSQMVTSGVLTVDPDLEDHIRARYDLPLRPETMPVAPQSLAAAERERIKQRRTQGAEVKLPDRELRREPSAVEVAAAVDFATMETTHVTALGALVNAWQAVRADQIAELAALITAAGGDEVALATIQATPAGADVLLERLRGVTAQGIDGALAEAAAQGATITAPDVESVLSGLESRAQATATLMARSLSEAAGRRAVALSGGSLGPADVADQVVEHLESLSDAYLEEQFTGLLTQGQNTGRRAVFDAAPSIRAVYASELLDASTCGPCSDVDGREYPDLAAAEEDYPTGGYKDCDGGPRCRGTLVAVYDDEEAPSVQ